jgi:succinate-semialdehyde dehydrogenase/glutarate-semialdehyde dehydrogenase
MNSSREANALQSLLKDPKLFRQQCYIDGQWVDADGGQAIAVTNPATGGVIGTIPKMGAGETRRGIEAADRALKAWGARTAKERSVVLRKWFDLMMANQDDLALIMTTEQGKPLAEAKGEIAYAASFVEWFAEEGKRIYGDIIPPHQADKRIVVLKQPIGVCGAITPWNFPAAMITRKAGPALAAGCTMVLSVVTGSAREIGAELTGNPTVRKITFTGSTEVGRVLMQQSAATVKKLSLELGGNAPFLVFDDADLDAAVDGAMLSKYRNAGQTCVCANRILVQDGVYDAFAAKLAVKVRALKVGPGTEAGVVIGPLIDANAIAKVEEHVQDAVSKGAKVVVGGKKHALGGLFYEPTLLTGVDTTMKVTKEETFGPVAPLFRFKTEEEGIAMANDTEFGLASYFYARDIGRIWRVGEGLESGIVGINTGIISTEVAPFGGVKQSGLGREGSKYGIEDFLAVKYMCMGGI